MQDTLLLPILNAGACLVIGLVLLLAILHPRVHDGLVIKAGLATACVGFLGLAWALLAQAGACHVTTLLRLLLLVHAGLAVVLLGYVLRTRRAHPLRRASDWTPLDDDPHHHAHHHPTAAL